MQGFCWANFKEQTTLRRPMYGWDSDLKIDVKEIGWEGMDWMNLAQTGAVGGLLWKRFHKVWRIS